MPDEKKQLRGVYERVPGSGQWWIRYSDHQGRLRREAVGPKGLARKLYHMRKAAVAERRRLPSAAQRRNVSLADMITEHLAREKGKAKSYKDMSRFGKYWTKELGDRGLREIVPGDVARYAAKRRKTGISQETLAHELSFLRRVFNVAIADFLAESNPVRGIKRPKSGRVRYLTPEEETALLKQLDAEGRNLALFAAHTGLRQAEQFKLKWENVDFAASVIRIPKTKTDNPRAVPMNDVVKQVLRALPRRLRTPWVFPGVQGKGPLNAHNFYQRVFVPAVTAAEIEGFRWHDLRHTFASRLVMAGVDIPTVAALLGHRKIEMTMRYAHLAPGHASRAVDLLSRKSDDTKTGTEGAAGEKR